MKRMDQVAGDAAPASEGVVLAEWWRRLGASIVDFAILWIPMWAVLRPMDVERPVRLVISFAIGTLYFALLNGGTKGQTIGKMVWGTRVRAADGGGPIGPAKAAVRYLAPALVSSVTFGLIWLPVGLWLFWDRRGQTLHDKLFGSVVVNA